MPESALECQEPIDWTGYRWPESEYFASERFKAVYCPITKVACSSLKLWWADIHEGSHTSFLEPLPDVPPVIQHDHLNDCFKLQRLLPRLGEAFWEGDEWFRFAFVRNPWARTVSAFVSKVLANEPQADPVVAYFNARRKSSCAAADLNGRSATNWQGLVSSAVADSPGKNDPGRQLLTFRHFVDYLSTLDLEEGSPHEVDIHWLPQYRFLADTRFHLIGRFEDLAADFLVVASRLGVEASLGTFNQTRYTRRFFVGRLADYPLYRLRDMDLPGYRYFYTPDLVDKVAKLYRRDVEQFGYTF